MFELQKPQLDPTENLKTIVTSAPFLKIFDSKLPTRLRTDVSSVGLGAFLKQNYETIEPPKRATLLAIHRKLYRTMKIVTHR